MRETMRIKNSYALSALAGIGIVGALAGCSSTGSASTSDSDSSPAATASPSASPSASAATSTGASKYKDGTYTEDGTYQSPAGEGRITVTITLASDVVTAIKVDGHATDPTAKAYQADFDGGIAGKVVGKKIDSLNVTNVSGSSLTSGGFDDALKKIEAEAGA
jgi:uncharacterized protein with FMN-binding domain